MSAEKKVRRQPPPASRSLDSAPIWWVIAAFAILIPLFYAPAGSDGFRLPKELLLRAEAILIVAVCATIALTRGVRTLTAMLPPKRTSLLVGTIAVWSMLACTLSTNRPLSVLAVEYTIAAIIVFLGTYAAVRERALQPVVIVATVGAIPNAILAFTQATSIWNPFHFDATLPVHVRTSALMGNANDVGGYLMLITLMSGVAALASHNRWWWSVTAILLVGLFASQSLTAMISAGAGFTALACLLPKRKKILGFAAIIVVVALAISTAGPMRQRLNYLRTAWRNRDYSELTSERIFPAVTAWAMFTDHPLTGIGPGTFKFHYLDYRRAFNERHPWAYLTSLENFGQVHSDHLQILSEEGLPGYVLFIAALLAIGSASLKHGGDDHRDDDLADPRPRFVRLGALPLALSFGILTLAAFPLETAAATQVALHFAAAVLAWNNSGEGA